MLRKTLIAMLMLCGGGSAWAEPPGFVAAASGPHRFEQMLDLGGNMSLVRTPELALELADEMSEPEFLLRAMVLSANPEIWLKAMERAGAPGVPKNLAQAASPEMLVDWFYSSIDPQFQHALLSRMLDPKKPQRWMQSMSDSRFYMPALATLNPATPLQWVKVTADGRVIKPMQTWFDPKTYANWMRLPAEVMAAGGKAKDPASAVTRQPVQRY
jgi:hypothetical protein